MSALLMPRSRAAAGATAARASAPSVEKDCVAVVTARTGATGSSGGADAATLLIGLRPRLLREPHPQLLVLREESREILRRLRERDLGAFAREGVPHLGAAGRLDRRVEKLAYDVR